MRGNLAQTLKERRKALGLTVKTVLDRLNEYGINISDKTFYGWESGHRQPDSDTFLTLCRIYDIDSLSVFLPGNENAPLYSSEAEAVARGYDGLDSHGKRAVHAILDEEMARMEAEAEKQHQAKAAEAQQQVAQTAVEMEAAPSTSKLYIAARDGSRMEVEVGDDFTLPEESATIP